MRKLGATGRQAHNKKMIPEELFLKIVQNACFSLLGIQVYPGKIPLNYSADKQKLRASIFLQGAEEGTIELTCSRDLAQKMASFLYDTSPDKISFNLMKDVLGELVNIIGGQVKTSMTTPCRLSLPTVSENQENKTSQQKKDVMNSLQFLCDKQPFEITLLKGASP